MSSIPISRTAQRDAVRMLYASMQRSVWFSGLASLMVFLIAAPNVALGPLTAWLLATLLALAFRRWRLARARVSPAFAAEPVRDFRRAAWLAATSGIVMGSAMLLFAPELPATERFVVTLIFLGTAAGAVAAMLASRLVYIAFAVPLMLLQALGLARVAIDDTGFANSMVVCAIVVYAACLCLLHHWGNRTFVQTITLKRQNESVLREKEALLIKLELDNAELLADRDAFLLASLTDALTGLANRRHFDKTLLRDWERARRESMWLSCIMLDVDHFKPFNDRYGHAIGDATLRRVADAIKASLNRGADFAARYGGEEFVILLPGTKARGALLLAERIRLAVEQMAFEGGERLTVSAGVAAIRPDSEDNVDAMALLRQADAALYEAKSAGRNRVMTVTHGGFGADDVVGDTV